jgi:hypothetical protein
MAASPQFKHVESLVFGADTLDMLTRKS